MGGFVKSANTHHKLLKGEIKRMIGENRIILGSTELEDKQKQTGEE